MLGEREIVKALSERVTTPTALTAGRCRQKRNPEEAKTATFVVLNYVSHSETILRPCCCARCRRVGLSGCARQWPWPLRL